MAITACFWPRTCVLTFSAASLMAADADVMIRVHKVLPVIETDGLIQSWGLRTIVVDKMAFLAALLLQRLYVYIVLEFCGRPTL